MAKQWKKLELHEAQVSPCNRIFIANALSVHDVNSAKKIHKEILSILGEVNSTEGRDVDLNAVKYVDIYSVDHLAEFLKNVHEQCKQGVLPIIHIEAHGDLQKGVAIANSDGRYEYLPWEYLVLQCQKINEACSGNLTIVLAMCHSVGIVEHCDVVKSLRMPFFAAYYYKGEAYPSDIVSDLRGLYTELLKYGKYKEDGYSNNWGALRELGMLQELLGFAVLAGSNPAYLTEQTRGAFSIRKMLQAVGEDEGKYINPSIRRKMVKNALSSGRLAKEIVRMLILNGKRRRLFYADVNKYFSSLR